MKKLSKRYKVEQSDGIGWVVWDTVRRVIVSDGISAGRRTRYVVAERCIELEDIHVKCVIKMAIITDELIKI